MALDIVRGRISNLPASQELIEIVENMSSQYDETLYLGYPLSADAESSITVDALLVSEKYGMVSFVFSNFEDFDSLADEQGEMFYQITNTLTQYRNLRKGRGISFEPQVISVVPNKIDNSGDDEQTIITTFDDLKQTIEKLPAFDNQYYKVLVESLQKISSIKPRKKRENVKIDGSKGSVIKKIEKEIANLDKWQKKAAMEMVEGPQRIRGLAGSGKTIVLALKAAYLHAQYPTWEIVITYYTRSLWQQYRDLITKFVFEFSRDEPDWDRIHLFHAWGSPSERGLYSEIARASEQMPVNFTNAKLKYGSENAFNGICRELIPFLPQEGLKMYDIVLVDEAQDLPASFFQLVYNSIKSPKRIVWAYDELQKLNSSAMPSIGEMFGVDGQGKPLVELKNESGNPLQDIILPVCYRNPHWSLALAHSLGFGVYRENLVQHFETLNLWKEIGYTIEKGKLDYGNEIVLSRSADTTPGYFKELLKPEEVIKTSVFEDPSIQYKKVAKEIRKNIEEDELDPDDILVIFPSALQAKRQYQEFSQYLSGYSIDSMLAGVTEDRDTFRLPQKVTCSTIYRAKGNEAPMVYILNADFCYSGLELISLRNRLFTAITRSRAWVNICGVGNEMHSLENEIQIFINKGYKLDFRIPTLDEMKKMRTINRERTASETRKFKEAEQGVQTFVELIESGVLEPSQVPGYSTLMKLLLSKEGSDNEEIDE